MSVIFEGHLQAEQLNICVSVSRFNELITQKLLSGAKDCFLRHGGRSENLHQIWVPGAYELPLACQNAAKMRRFDAIIALGAVIRGATSHYDIVATQVSKGVAHVGLTYNVPTIFGVLTTDSIEQALERAGTKHGNKGYEAMMGAIEMGNLMKNFES